ncbi:MAG: tetratricopeptide repeat protein, partial [bacterium]
LKTADLRPNNIPVELTSFVGRNKELDEIKSLLGTSRLLTLAGTGGTGKTRLAVRAGADVIDEFEDGVWLTELAPLVDPSLIINTIAASLNIKEEGGRKITDIVIDFLKDKEIFLILDNCEHVIKECSLIVQTLLNKCPKLKILCSSREPLNLSGEKVFHVPTLSLPEPKEVYTVESVRNNEAVRLFEDRAKAVKDNFEITEGNAYAVVQLCRRLDGIPLAIELAAARIKVLSVEKILDNISNRFQLLSKGSRTALPRQQTLRALIDWSYDLLSEKEKLFFASLSVFSGGWNIETAEKICVDDNIDKSEVLELMSNLIDKSLVVSKEKNGAIRYSMFETIRQYSNEKLTNKNEIYRRYFKYYFHLVKKELHNLDTANEINWEAEMIIELDNVRSAMKWSMENLPVESSKFVEVVVQYLETKGNYVEAFDVLKKLFSMNVKIDASIRAGLSVDAGYIANQLGENEIAEKFLIEGLEYFRSVGNNVKTAEALITYGIIFYTKGDSEIAIKYSEEGLKLLEGTNEKEMIADVKSNIASYQSGSGNMEISLKLIEEAIEIYRELNNKVRLTKLLISKGGVYLQNGDLEKAVNCFEEGLILLEVLNDQHTLAITLYNLGNVNFTQKKYSESMNFYERAMAKSKEFGNTGVYDRSQIKLGEIFLAQNENDKAKKIFVNSLKDFNRHSEKLKLCLAINGLAKYYFYEKNYEMAARFFFLTDRISEDMNFRFSKSRLDENKLILDEIKTKLPRSKFDALLDEVMLFDLDNASTIALELSD